MLHSATTPSAVGPDGSEQQSACCVAIERVAVVALARRPGRRGAARSTGRLKSSSDARNAGGPRAAQATRQLVTEAGLACGGQAVDRDSQPMITERIDHGRRAGRAPERARARRRWHRLLPRRDRELMSVSRSIDIRESRTASFAGHAKASAGSITSPDMPCVRVHTAPHCRGSPARGGEEDAPTAKFAVDDAARSAVARVAVSSISPTCLCTPSGRPEQSTPSIAWAMTGAVPLLHADPTVGRRPREGARVAAEACSVCRFRIAVPEPIARGEPEHGYPFPWAIYRWIPGRDVHEWSAFSRRKSSGHRLGGVRHRRFDVSTWAAALGRGAGRSAALSTPVTRGVKCTSSGSVDRHRRVHRRLGDIAPRTRMGRAHMYENTAICFPPTSSSTTANSTR